MKKIYKMPEVDILDVMTEDMIANSPVENGFDKATATELQQSATSGNLSRQNDMWETYEEPEY